MIKILHLYYDLMNLYGENANVRALVKKIEEQGQKVIVDFKSLEDKINIDDYSFIYVGSGTSENLELAKKDFKRLEKDIKKYIDNNKFCLATGNGLDLFEHVLKFKTKQIDFRIVGDQLFESSLINKDVLGFQNRNSVLYDNEEEILFHVKNGTGSELGSLTEGIMRNHFYGTYLLGPLLIRNPHFLDYLLNELFQSMNLKYEIKETGFAYKAYEQGLINFGTYE